MVKGGLIPKTYADLARPEFKGQLLGLDPDAVGVYAAVWRHILEMVGEETIRAIGRKLIKNPLYADVQPAAQALGAGAGMVLMEMGANVGQTMRISGAPVGVVMPEKTVGSEYAYVVAAKPAHPNAAKLFAHWLYSAEGQWVTSCAALAATIAYPAYGSKEFTATRPVPKDQVAKIKQLLDL